MLEEDMDISLKVIVVGNGMVGKTSMINRYARGVMTDNYKKTIGTDFMEKETIVRSTGQAIKLMLWDTAGQEMFSKLTRNYYRGAGAVVYVFSTTDRASFLEIERWKQKVEEETNKNIISVLVQNKIDCLNEQQMSKDEVEALSKKLQLKLYRCCVKENLNVDAIFEYVAEEFLARGGEKNMDGVEAVPEITSLANNSNDNDKNDNSSSLSSSSLDDNNSEQSRPQVAKPAASNKSNTVALEPLTRRTGGKKKLLFCTIS